ncbi:MAG: LysR family transcriptional regulator, partial [Firmicutes bacterium]|nr:LysR family transcriptional regulator [Bacillota bacterium]
LLKDKYASGQVRKKFKVSCQHYSLAAKAFVETVKKYGTGRFDFEISETRTMDVITDVGSVVSELGILFISDYNRRYLEKLFKERELTFTGLVTVQAFVCLYCGHPLAKNESIGFDELAPYPNMSFDQGENASLFLNEEILADNDYPQTIKVNDRATMLNLLKGLNGYTFCPGVISEELHGSDYVAVPYRPDEDNPGRLMEIGYITRSRSILSDVALDYISELKKCFSSGSAV